MNRFTEALHRRDRAGKFTDKANTPPAGSLTNANADAAEEYRYPDVEYRRGTARFIHRGPTRSEVASAWRSLAPDATPVDYDPDMLLERARAGFAKAQKLDKEDLRALESAGIDGASMEAFESSGFSFDPTRKARGRRRVARLVDSGLIYLHKRTGTYRLTLEGWAARGAQDVSPGLRPAMWPVHFNHMQEIANTGD